ncbi:MAG: AAA family ATPase [Candidatus Acidiferrales bacterium]
MYKAYFHLKLSPFEVSPDPYFMYATPYHHEAFASLCYGIRSRKGFMVMTGEVGTGKTLVLRCLTDYLDENQIRYAYIFNPLLSSDEFLRYTLADLNLRVPTTGKNDILLQFYAFLAQRQRSDQTTVLIVDEAHLLSQEVLEEVRLLGNLESQRSKLLQIALVGQPELDSRLDSPNLRQLKQRIALRCQLQPLTLEQTGEYIKWRLARAGAVHDPAAPEFPPEAIMEVFEYSQGYPRLINTICENALIFACGAETRIMSRELVVAACKDLHMEKRQAPAAADGGPPQSGNPPSGASAPESQKMSVELVQTAVSSGAHKGSVGEVHS